MAVEEVSCEYGGRLLTLQTGKLAKQADASVLAKYGDTMVLVAVVSARKLGASQDFFPLTVDFQERYYSAGRLPGGFFKREAKPSDRATLSARCIDRPMRPLFPEDYLFETNVVVTVLSTDGVNETDFVASIAASAALHISDIPFEGPVGSIRVGCIEGHLITNPPPADQPNSTLELLVSGVRTGAVMVEGSAKEVTESQMMDALDYAQKEIQPILDMQDELRKRVGKPKREYEKPKRDEALKKKMRTDLFPDFAKAFAIPTKLERYAALDKVKKAAETKFGAPEGKTEEDVAKNKLVKVYLEELKAAYAREMTVDKKKRIDGRPFNEIRPITCETSLLPRVHGSGLFTRGETQVLATVTLGTADDEQKIDSINGVYQKTFLLHYNFPPFSVGEARPLRPPSRRDIGHGFLAERALSSIIPDREAFPYTLRIVSEVLESNGSSSMATVCSGSLALMDAGVPIKKAVAGVAMGLIKEGNKIAVLSDILGDEDHLGDMDFKVCGTREGITAFQMDLKIGGVSREIMEQALEQAREGRLHILGKMDEALSAPRANQSPYAPRIFTMKVKPDKVREVIGSGGKVIRGIIERTGVKIDIEDDGTIHIASVDETSAQKAMDIIGEIVMEPEIGKIYEGRVTKIADFGAFVEIFAGTEGLCHISELEHHRVRYVDDVVRMGDMIRVKCLDVDPSGKIRLSRKALLDKNAPRPEVAPQESAQPQSDLPPDAQLEEMAGEVKSEGHEAERALREERRLGPSGRHWEDRGNRDAGGRGPRSGGRDDRGPRDDRPPRDDRGPRDDRPRDDRPRDDRPRDDRPPRDDRGGGRYARGGGGGGGRDDYRGGGGGGGGRGPRGGGGRGYGGRGGGGRGGGGGGYRGGGGGGGGRGGGPGRGGHSGGGDRDGNREYRAPMQARQPGYWDREEMDKQRERTLRRDLEEERPQQPNFKANDDDDY